MRLAINLIFLFFAFPSSAISKPIELFSLNFESGKAKHTYSLQVTTAKDQKYTLSFKDGAKVAVTKQMNRLEGKTYAERLNSIVWENEFKKPKGLNKCTTYATLKNSTAKSKVCVEDPKITGLTYGLLNSLSREFK